MRSSLADSLGPAMAFLPAILASAEDRKRVLHLAAALPPIARVLLECRLGSSSSRLDFSQAVLRSESDHRLLAEAVRIHRNRFLANPEWRTILSFCESWSRPGSALRRVVKDVWFEFDAPATVGDPALPVPGVGLTISKSHFDSATATRKVLDEALPRLQLSTTGITKLDALDALDALPRPGRISHVGAMLSRGATHFRANLRGLDANSGWDWARASIPGFGSFDKPPGLWNEMWQLSGQSILAADFGIPMGARLGVEYVPTTADQWAALLDYVTDLGICDRAKVLSLAAWSGMQSAASGSGPPFRIAPFGADDNSSRIEVIACRFNHLKVGFVEGVPVEAKLYLWIEHLSLDPERATPPTNDPAGSNPTPDASSSRLDITASAHKARRARARADRPGARECASKNPSAADSAHRGRRERRRLRAGSLSGHPPR